MNRFNIKVMKSESNTKIFLSSHILSKLQLSVFSFATLFWCLPLGSFLCAFFFFILFVQGTPAEHSALFFHLASHSHLGAARCNYSPFLRSHVQLQQRSWCFAYFPKGRKKESVPATPSLSQEFELATFQSLMCLQAIAVLFIMKHMRCLLLERKSVIFMTKSLGANRFTLQ